MLAQRSLLVGSLLAAAAAAPGCGASSETVAEESDATEDGLTAPGGRFGPALFRNDFYTYLRQGGQYSDEQIRSLVFMPTEFAMKPFAPPNPAAPLKPYDEAYSRLHPMDFYEQGLVTPLVRKIGPNGPLENELRRNPVHIVVVPGIFGEFISVSPFTTQARLDWFRTHVLPTNIRYYALTGTMGDFTPVGAQPTPLVLNPTAYDTRSIDFKSLRSDYYSLFAASQNQLQDSQVTVARARFWPEIHAMLNPAQGELKTHFMGTVGVHHWGLSFPRAFATNDGLQANPFPRTLLLKSIATFVAQVESRNP